MISLTRHAACALWVGCAAALMLAAGCGGDGDGSGAGGNGAPDSVAIYSGSQTGVYYPTAQAISTLAQKHDPSLIVDVRTSGGSVANANHIKNGEADFAIMQSDIAAYALAGKAPLFDAPIDNLVGVASLYPEHVQIVARKDSGIRTVADLAGKRVAIGDIGSGTEQNALQILEAYGLSTDNLGKVERLNSGTATDYLKDNRIDAAFYTFGVGTAAIRDLAYSTKGQLTFVPVTGEERDKLIEAYSFYRPAVIPAKSYDGQTAEVQTVSVMATLVARKDVSARTVQKMLEGVFDNLSEFKKAHMRLSGVTKQAAHDDLALPLHDGAAAYYGSARAADEKAAMDADAPAPQDAKGDGSSGG